MFCLLTMLYLLINVIGGVIVSLLSSSVVDRGLVLQSGRIKAHSIKKKDWLARNRDNVSEWEDISIRRLFFSELAL